MDNMFTNHLRRYHNSLPFKRRNRILKQNQTIMKIKKTFVEKIERETEMEIKIPYFFKMNGSESIHAILENNTIRIWNDSISFVGYKADTFVGEGNDIEITAEEFTTAFDSAIEKLQSLKSHFFKP